MSYGAEFRNNDGIVVISDNRLVETFLGKASYSGVLGATNGRVFRFVIASSRQPSVYIHTRNGRFASIFALARSGGSYVIDIATDGWPSDLEVYCFAQVPGGDTETSWGMNIYNAAGDPVFSSNWKILNVKGIASPPQFGGTRSHGVPGLVKPAAMCPCNSGQRVSFASGQTYMDIDDRDIFRVTATTISTFRARLYYDNDSYWGVGSPPYDLGNQSSTVNVPPVAFPIIDAAQYD